jgi:hypothetical protein
MKYHSISHWTVPQKKIQYKTLIPWSLSCQLEFLVGFKILVAHFDNQILSSDFKVWTNTVTPLKDEAS